MENINLHPVIACGMCIDTIITGFFPFLVYWLVCLLFWSLLVGPVCLGIAKKKGIVKAASPSWLMLGFIVAIICASPISMGAVVTPLILILPFWGIAIMHALRRNSKFWKKSNFILLGVLLVCIPLSYIVSAKPFSEYRKLINTNNSINLPNDGD